MRVEHFGYLGAVRDTKDKSHRNIELLERQVAEGVDNPFLHFNLGSEYAATGDVARALTHFERAWTAVRAAGPRQQRRLRAGAGLALRPRAAQRRPPGRRRRRWATRCSRSSRASPTSSSSRRWPPAPPATPRARRRCCAAAWRWATGPSRYSATVGCGTYRALVALADVLRRRGAVDEAEETLRGCLQEHPGFLAAVDPYAALLLRRGVPAAEVVETVHALVADSSPSMRFLLAVALSEAGAVAEAEAELRAVLEAQPGQRPRARRAGRDAAGPGPLRRRRRRGRRGRPRGALRRRRRSAPSSSPC